MKRRDFLKRGLAATGGAMLLGSTQGRSEAETPEGMAVPVVKTTAPGGHYLGNRAPLQPSAFLKLPIGSITPKGWLRHQLELQAEGLNGRMPEVSDYLKYEGNGWVTPGSNVGWEEVPYWLRGFGDLGYVLGDERVIALATQWVNGILTSQQADGWFGPQSARTSLDGGPDLWPHMPVLEALRSYHEYKSDPRVLAFLTKYFQYQTTVPATQFIKSWAGVRWGNNLDSILWLYNRTGEGWLLDLATKIHNNSADYVNTIPTWHNVNLSQGFREPAEYGQIAQDPKFLAATERVYDTFMGLYGQFPGGGFAGDENCRAGFHDPRQGFETCGIVELMQSFEILTRITGDPKWSDRTEELAFNSMPAAFDPQQKGTHYITSANSIELDNVGKQHFQYANGTFPMQAFKPGVHDYRCCPHNYGMGWPYYAEEMWLGTADRGLCASLYAPSEVNAYVGDGTPITIAQETEYPFGDTIKLTLTAPQAVAFPLYLRVPHWCQSPTVKVNGRTIAAHAGPQSYLVVNRSWKNNDVVTLHLPMQPSVRVWEKNNNSISVDHGPLTFSLLLEENWHRYAGTERWPEYEVHTTAPWNYGLVLDHRHPNRSFGVHRKAGALPTNPFTHETNPIELRAKAKRIPAWQPDADGVVSVLQPSPARSMEATETVTLIPMGAARLRICSFPQIGDAPDAHEWVAPPAPFKPEHGIAFSYSHLNSGDVPLAFGNPATPSSSDDQQMGRFTWWPQQGSQEWVEYDFDKPRTLHSTDVYWYDDTGHGGCRVPDNWHLVYWDGAAWQPVNNPSGSGAKSADAFGATVDKFNHVSFDPMTTTKVRIIAQLQKGFSGGILTWRLG